MSFSTEEVNYLIWRYFQETGLELPAYALSDQTAVNDFDEKYKDHVPIGSLVSLIQKGILYSQTDRLVNFKGEIQDEKLLPQKFTIFHALGSDMLLNEPIEATGRFAIDDGTPQDSEDIEMKDSNPEKAQNNNSLISSKKEKDDFIFVPERIFTYEPSTVSTWNPTAPTVLAYGLTESRAKITVFVPGKPEETTQVTLTHPISVTSLTHGDSDSASDITMLAWSPLGHLLVTAVETGEVRLWTADGKLRNVLSLHHSPVLTINWSPDSQYFLTTDASNSTILWDSNTGSVVQNIDLSDNKAANALGMDACWMSKTKFVMPGTHSTAMVYNVGERSPVGKLVGHSAPITHIKYNKEGSLVLSVSGDKTIRVWNGQTFNNSQILTGHTQEITYAAWVNKNIIVSTSLDSSLRLWDVRDGSILSQQILEGLPIIMASFSPDRTKIALSTTENTIVVFRIDITEKGDELKLIDEYSSFVPIEGEEVNDDERSYITSLEWSSDSRFVVAGHAKYESIVLKIC